MSKKTPRLLKLLKNSERDHFQFTIQFQLELLRFLIQSKESILYIGKVKSSYFTILEHCLICESLLKVFKKYKKIPSEPILLESISELLSSKDYQGLVTQEDLGNITTQISKLYKEPIKDSDIIKANLAKFIAYIEIKSLNDATDFSNYDQYNNYMQKFTRIIRETTGDIDGNKDPALYMVEGTTLRQLHRKIDPEVLPTPYKQLNELSNAGGYPSGSVVVLLDKAKAKKTFTLLNVSRGYLSMKKNVLYIDTENGSNQIMSRMVQSTLKKTKRDMISGEFDQLEKKHMRKYHRLNSEFIVKRVPALIADTNVIKGIIQEIEHEKNIKIHVLVIDYAGKLASTSRDKDDFERIGNAYIDIQNLALDIKLDAVWTAHHITREGSKHQETRYEENDISGSISIVRNAQCIIGLNSTEEERENNVQRMEIVVQRDGHPSGRALFNIDVEKQYMKEFSREARKAYDETQGVRVDSMISKSTGKRTNANADSTKVNNKSGDV